MKNKVLCFTGHRNLNLAQLAEIRQRLRTAILNAYNDGYRFYISGMAKGFDLMAADEVLKFKLGKLKDIKLVAAIPHDKQERRYSLQDKQLYQQIINNADKVVFVNHYYYKGCYLERDMWMLRHSTLVIAYYDITKYKGGTFYTVKRAERTNKQIINIF